MKSKIILTFATVLTLAACSKEGVNQNAGGTVTIVSADAVPARTTSAFTAEFSGATAVEWSRNSSSSFTVQFNHSSQRHSAGYDDNGHRSSHSIICTDGPVPQVVLDAFRQLYPGDVVYEWSLRNDGNWRAHIMRGTVKYEATFSASGSLLKFEKSA